MSYNLTSLLADSPAMLCVFEQTSGTNAPDQSGNSRDLTYTGGYTQGITGPGTSNLAVTLNGTTGFIGRSSSVVGNVDAGEGITMEVWAKFTTTTADLALISLANSGNNTPLYYFRTNGSTPRGAYAQFRSDASVLNSTFTQNVAVSVNDGNWHHFVTTYNASTTNLRVYIDGAAVGSPTTATFGTTTLNTTTVGAVQRTTNLAFFPGSIWLAAIYPSELSAARISAHYSGIFTASNNSPFFGFI